MTIRTPESSDAEIWEERSLEQALYYPSDILFNNTLPQAITPEALAEDPIFGSHPAIAAGQVGRWNSAVVMSYQGLSSALNDLESLLAKAHTVS
ncbi:MAG: hypothetical protein QM753_16310 [Thermomicrobiales bacterium]